MLTDIGTGDAGMYYGDCVFKHKDGWFQAHDFKASAKRGLIASGTLRKTGGEEEERRVPLSELSIEYPKLGYVYMNNRTYFLQQPFGRVHKRAFNPRSLHNLPVVQSGGIYRNTKVRFAFNSLRDIPLFFDDRKFFTPTQALMFLKGIVSETESRVTVPLSPNFAVWKRIEFTDSGRVKSCDYCLIYKRYIIGSVNKKGNLDVADNFKFLKERLLGEVPSAEII